MLSILKKMNKIYIKNRIKPKYIIICTLHKICKISVFTLFFF